MSFNGSGTFVINTAGQPVVPNTVISATAFNALTNDLANGLSTCITKDGQTTPTANIPMGNNKITGLAPGTSGTDAANLSQVQGSTAKLLQSVTGTDTITAAMVPALTSYSAGQMFYFVAAGDNTGAVTINIDSLGAKSVTRDGSTALVAGDIVSGEVALIVYDGTRFQLLNGNSFTNLNVSGTLAVGSTSTFTGAATFTANPTLSGNTANGVLYLNGSKVATSGSNLTYSGTTLSVKAGNGDQLILNNAGERFTQLTLQNNGVTKANLNFDNTNSLVEMYGVAGTSLIFSPNATEGMRLTSTGLGIGTTPAAYAGYNTLAQNATTGSTFEQRVGGTLTGSLTTDSQVTLKSLTAIPLVFGTNNTERMRLDSSGNLGLGVTPSAWGTRFKAIQGGVSGGGSFIFDTLDYQTQIVSNAYFDGTDWRYTASFGASKYAANRVGHAWEIAPSGTAGNTITFTQSMTLDASGNLGVGATSPSVNGIDIVKAGGTATYVRTSDGTYSLLSGVSPSLGGALIGTTTNHPVLFYSNNTERGRFTAGGFFKASNDGTYVGSTSSYHELRTNGSAGEWIARFGSTTSTAANCFGIYTKYENAAPNGTGNQFLTCEDNAATRAVIRSNGGLANYQANDVNLSDERTKKDIAPLGSMWAKFKALEIVTFKYKDQTHDDDNIGVIAQQVESVAPEFVDADGWGETPEDGVPLKSVYTADMYHAAIKALQEAMARIESLEAKVAALEAK